MRIESFLEQSPIFQANRIARRMDASLTLALQPEDLSVFESLVLAAIFFEKRGAIKPSDLAEAFQTTRGNVSHCVSSLEAKRLVERRLNPDDARALQLLLTPLGKRKAVRVVAILDRTQRRIEESVGVASLQATLRQMNAIEDRCQSLATTRG